MGVREDLLAAVKARVAQVMSTGDYAPVLEPAALNQARQLAALAGDDDLSLQAAYLLGWLHLFRFQALPEGQDRQDLDAAVSMFTPCFINEVGDLPEPLLPVLAGQAIPAATVLLGEATGTGDQALITRAVDLWQRIVNVLPAGHPGRARCLSNLGMALHARFGQTGSLADLDAATAAFRAALDATPPGHPDQAALLSNLGGVLHARFARTGALADLQAAIQASQAAVDASPPGDPDRAMYLSNLEGALRTRFARTGAQADLDAAMTAGQAAVDATPPGHPARPNRLSALSLTLQVRFGQTGELKDLDAAITAGQAALDAVPSGSPGRAAYLANLGSALQARFGQTGELEDLDAAITAGQAAVNAVPSGSPGRAAHLANLGSALQARFRRTGELKDLDAAITAGQAAVNAAPSGSPGRAAYLANLGSALQARFRRTGELKDLDAAITASHAAVDAGPPGSADWATCLSTLGTALQDRFERTGELADADAAIQADQAAADATPAGHPGRARYLSNLAGALLARFGQAGGQTDLDAAITAGQAAVDATPAGHPDQTMYLTNLANARRARFEQTGGQTDLDAAVTAGQAAVDATPAGHPDRARYLSNLASALLVRFEQAGGQTDLDAAITAGQAAVDATPAGHPDRTLHLSSLGAALQAKFERTGALADLDAAIQAYQAAVAAIPPSHINRAKLLTNLGSALRARFGRTGALADLDAAIQAAQAAVDATPPSHPGLGTFVSNLGVALRARFERTGALADLDAAIRAAEAAVDATPPGHPRRAGWLSNLGGALRARFGQTGELADLNAAIQAVRAAVAEAPLTYPGRAGYLTNLGNALLTRFERTGEMADLAAAIQAGQAAVDAALPGHPIMAVCLANLGGALRARFDLTGTEADRQAALSTYARAAEVDPAPPSMRIRMARAAAALAAESAPGRAAGLLEMAVRLLGEVAPRQLERSDQQYAIGGFAGLAGDAAALALADTGAGASRGERAARALGLLEAGRAVLLSQALDTRSDLTDLRHQHPELAARFTELRADLDQPEDLSAPVVSPDLSPALPGRAAENRRRLAGEFTAVLKLIRALDGFASFGLPPAASDLLGEAGLGPVVTFCVSTHGSYALLLTEDGITSLELPGLGYETLIGQINSFHQARRTAANPGIAVAGRITAERKLLEILEWLWDAAAGAVLDALGFRQPPPPGAAWPRIWWVPGGLLSLLPIHAAGYQTPALGGEQTWHTVMDRVISSYTPTIRALRHARQHPSAAAGRALIVAMPATPGLPGGGKLPNVLAEVARVRGLLPDSVLLAEPGDQRAGKSSGIPTRANVLRQLPDCPVVHFACHGFTDPADPSRSLLVLHDHDSAPLTIASLAPVDLGQAQLAYLSACDTAPTSTGGLIDEAIQLTNAFQLAGFPHVIGTLWEISDQMAVTIAGSFYTTLRTGPGTVDTSRAALALHDAARAARDELPRTPSLWAAYIHAGS